MSGSRRSETRPATELCRDVLAAQDCFDIGQDTLLTFEVEDEEAIAWLVVDDYLGASAVWPASCGEPSLLVVGVFKRGCKDISAIGPGGVLGRSTRYCEGEGEGDESDGCSVGGTPRAAGSWPWMIAVLALACRARALGRQRAM